MELTANFSLPRHRGPSPPSRQMQQGRAVRFAPTIEVEFVEDLSVEHRADLFYSQQDIASFQMQVARQARIIKKIKASCGGASEYAQMMSELEDTSAFLGLESLLTDPSRRETLRRRRAHAAVVLLEQMRQISIGVRDAEVMAGVSEEASRQSWRRARIIALIHAANAD